MKKNQIVMAAVLFIALIVLPVTASVNKTSGKHLAFAPTMVTDGSPIPPMPPHAKARVALVANDGSPIPPMPPHASQAKDALIADGSPIPPMPPHAFENLVAA
jgi:hypothetical protein